MTARQVPLRRRPDRRRSVVAVPHVVVLALTAGLLGGQLGPGVRASFLSQTAHTTGRLSFASLSAAFAAGTNDFGAVGGVGGATYTMQVSLPVLATTTHRFTTLTNTSSVAAALSGVLTGTATTGSLNVSVDSCSIAWGATVCAGTLTSLRSATALSSTPSITYGALSVNGLFYLRFTFTSTTALASATVTAQAVPTGTGSGNRTAG